MFYQFLCVPHIADLPHSPGVVYYHLLLRRETRIPGVAPFSFRIGIWDLFVHRGQNPMHPQPLGSCGPLQGSCGPLQGSCGPLEGSCGPLHQVGFIEN